MRRIEIPARPNWIARCEEVGFNYHSLDGIYWNECVAYEFTADQIDHLEAVTENLHKL